MPTACLLRGKTPSNNSPEYDTKPLDGEAPVMLYCNFSQVYSDSVVVSVIVLSMG